MKTIYIQADDDLIMSLTQIARSRSVTLEAIANDALIEYLQRESTASSERYSFIGIGHSGKGNLSTSVEDILEKAGNRREGWSLNE